VKRRDFVTLIGGAAAGWPFAARGQHSKVARIGVLYIGLADAESFKKELREGLREFGHIEGQNIAFEFRSGEGKLDRLPELAADLVRLKVDVIAPPIFQSVSFRRGQGMVISGARPSSVPHPRKGPPAPPRASSRQTT
jgi:hypothetical protein